MVTEPPSRKRAEKKPIHLIEAAIDQVDEAVLVTTTQLDPPGPEIVYVNDGFCRMTGYAAEEVVGETPRILQGPKTDRAELDRLRRCLSRGQPFFGGEATNYRKDGSEYLLEWYIVPLRNDAGETTHWMASQRDVTERKLIEKQLRQNEERLNALVNATFEGILVTEEGTILETNQALLSMFGYELQEVTGSSVFNFVAPEYHGLVRQNLASGAEEPYEIVGVSKDGGRMNLEVRGRTSRYQSRFVRVTAVRDITENKRREEELHKANRRLQELAMLRADFTAMIAHELDTPIAAIRGLLDMLETGELNSADRARRLGAIQDETDKLSVLVTDVREAAAVEREDFTIHSRPVAVEELLEETAAFANTLSADHPITVENSAPGEVEADRRRISQVVRNLISNAVKYSAKGTPIEVRATPERDRVRFEVADQGSGIHHDDVSHIFSKFGRGRDNYSQSRPGMGLGLYISRCIVQAHGSELTVDSTPGEGSVFSFGLEAVR